MFRSERNTVMLGIGRYVLHQIGSIFRNLMKLRFKIVGYILTNRFITGFCQSYPDQGFSAVFGFKYFFLFYKQQQLRR
jgi:hypothetical protein